MDAEISSETRRFFAEEIRISRWPKEQFYINGQYNTPITQCYNVLYIYIHIYIYIYIYILYIYIYMT